MPDPKKVIVSTAQEVDDAGQSFKGVIAGAVTALKGLIVDAAKKLDVLNIGTSSIDNLTADNLTVQNLTAEHLAGAIERSVASYGRLANIVGVEGAKLYARLLGNPLDKNLLLLAGDDNTFAANTSFGVMGGGIGGDVLLGMANVKSNAMVGSDFYPMGASIFAQVVFSVGMKYTAGTTGVKYELATAKELDGSITNACRSVFTGGAAAVNFDSGIFNLAALGTLTADQVVAINSLAELYSWALAGSGAGGDVDITDTWALIGTWLAIESERNAFLSILRDSHVSGMEMTEVHSVNNRGGNLAYIGTETITNPRTSGVGGFYDLSDYNILETGISFEMTSPTAEGIGLKYGLVGIDSYSLTLNHVIEPTQLRSAFFHYDANDKFISEVSIGSALNGTGSISKLNQSVPEGTAYVVISFSWRVGDGFSTISNIQLNAGSTANDYEAPLDEPFLIGAKSANLGGAYDDADEVEFTNIYETQFFTLCSDSSGTWATGATIEAAVEIAKGETYTWTGLGAGVLQFMVLKGEPTQAEIRDLGYETFEPWTIATCPDNAGGSTKSDEMYVRDGKLYFKDNVSRVAGFLPGDPELDPAALYDSDYTVNADGFVATRATVTGNIDAISDGVTSKDNVLRTWADATPGNSHRIDRASTVIEDLINYQIDIVYYIPAANTNVNAFEIAGEASELAIFSTTGVWVTESVRVEGKAGALRVYQRSAAGRAFDGANLVTDDLVYIALLEIYPYNIYENEAPEETDITPFVISGSLDLSTREGQNQILSDGNMLLALIHKTGLQGMYDDVREIDRSKANISDTDKYRQYEVNLSNTDAMAASDIKFYEFNQVDRLPDLLSHIKYQELSKHANVLVYYFPNMLVFVATGAVGDGDALYHGSLRAGEPIIIDEVVY